jgi:predicted MFS family arabinose efflux permease
MRARAFIPLIALAGVVSHAFGRATMPILLPAVEDDLLHSVVVAGSLGTVNFAAYLTGVVLVTAWAGRLEPIHLLRSGVGIVTVGLTVLALAPSIAFLVLGVALAGFGGAGIWLSAPGIATADVSGDRRGRVMGSLTATMGVSLVAIPQVTTLIRLIAGDDRAWRPVWAIEAVAAGALLVALVTVVRVAPTPPIRSGLRMAPLKALPGWLPTTAAYVVFALIAATFTQFLGLMLEDDDGFGSSHIGLVFSTLGIASATGPLLYGRLSDHLGRNRVMALAMLGMAAGCAIITVGHEPYVLLGVAVFASSSFSYPSLSAAYVGDHTTARAFGAVFGMMTIFYGPGALTGPLLGGLVGSEAGSFTPVYLGLCVLAVLGATMAWLSSRATTVDPIEDDRAAAAPAREVGTEGSDRP